MSMDTWVSVLVDKSWTYSKTTLEGTIRLDSLIMEQSRIALIQLSQTCVLLPPNFPSQVDILRWACIWLSLSEDETLPPQEEQSHFILQLHSLVHLPCFALKQLTAPAEIFLILWPWNANAQEICLPLTFPSRFCKASMFQQRFKGIINQLHLYLTLP